VLPCSQIYIKLINGSEVERDASDSDDEFECISASEDDGQDDDEDDDGDEDEDDGEDHDEAMSC